MKQAKENSIANGTSEEKEHESNTGGDHVDATGAGEKVDAEEQPTEEDEEQSTEEDEEQPTEEDKEAPSESESILGILGLFGTDVPVGGAGYRIISELLLHFDHAEQAESACRKALDAFEAADESEKLKTGSLLTRILLKRSKKEEALQLIDGCAERMQSESIPTSLKRLVLTTKAQVETSQGNTVAASEAYAAARTIDPTGLSTGKTLTRELALVADKDDREGYMRTLKSWSPLERLTWLCSDYEDKGTRRNAVFCDIATATGESEFLVSVYTEAIRYLDNVNAGAPLRVDLARAYVEVMQDPQSARKMLEGVFDSNSNGYTYSVTDEEPQTTLHRALDLMTDVLLTIFRASRDPAVKTEVFTALKGLMQRSLPLDIPIYTAIELVHHRLVIAAMCLKMSQATEFEQRLREVIKDCFAGLSDSVGWNDGENLEKLAHALVLLSKAAPGGEDIRRLARIVCSAMFSKVSQETTDDSDSDSDSDSSSESSEDDDDDDDDDDDENADATTLKTPTDEGDLGDSWYVTVKCSGSCKPQTSFAFWGGRVAYYCATCSNALLCEACYQARAEAAGEARRSVRHYCGVDHDYLKLPVEGWRGVKDGKLTVEGKEMLFSDLLKDLQEKVCEDGWGRFWAD